MNRQKWKTQLCLSPVEAKVSHDYSVWLSSQPVHSHHCKNIHNAELKCRQFLTYKLARELNVVRYVRYAGLIPDSFPPPVRAALAAVREGWNKVIKQVWAGPGRIRQDLYDSSAFQNSAYFSLPRSLALKPEKLATYSHSLQIYTLHTALHRSPS